MAQHAVRRTFRLRGLWILVALALGKPLCTHASDAIQFNTDVLDVKDRANFDLSRFAYGGYVMPGTYTMTLRVNQQELPEQQVTFATPADNADESLPCLTPALTDLLNLKPDYLASLTWRDDGRCLDNRALSDWTIKGDLASSSLTLTIPQAYLEYDYPNWDPPARWDNGVIGGLFDYNLNFTTIRQPHRGNTENLTGNGTAGFNAGPWRLRADWQMQRSSQNNAAQNRFEWSRYYLYRALPSLMARLSLGENYLSSDIFDSFRFTGAVINTDNNMLPPNLRGYAPEVAGVAKTNAKITVSQQGRVIYETQVAPGPFRIQDLNDAVSGTLDVRVEEQDGSVKKFSLDTASIPYLTRPGRVRYKLAAGRPTNWRHHVNGPLFATGEFSWGVSNGWSLYSGAVGSDGYNALAAGVGRNLMLFGALSFDVTRSQARLPHQRSLAGQSYRLSYAKRFEEYDSQVTFAGYRFSDRHFMSMGDFLDARLYGGQRHSSKEMYTVTFNKQFNNLGLGLFLNYNHQTYWNSATNDHYDLSLSRYFDIGKYKNLSFSLSAYRNKYHGANDDGMYLSFTMPWGENSSLSYNNTWNKRDTSHQVSYWGRLDDKDTYQIGVGTTRHGPSVNGYYTHMGDVAQLNANASYQEGSYTSAGLSLQGGATVTAQGGALHRVGKMGGTRILLDADSVPSVPFNSNSGRTRTNRFGKAVIADINSYYRNQISINLNQLGDKVEVLHSVEQATLTEGAIGFRRFDVLSGFKSMAAIRLADGSAPPFGATVKNDKNKNVGIVNDDGMVYLSGIQPGGVMTVHWRDQEQCRLHLPQNIAENMTQSLLLPCQATNP